MPRTEFDRPDPLAGDHIMDATARLLAPRKSALGREKNPAAPRTGRPSPLSRRKGGETEPQRTKERTHTGFGAKAGRKKRGGEPAGPLQPAGKGGKKAHGGPRGPMEPMKSNRTKDSTEQHSLMKPYYLDD